MKGPRSYSAGTERALFALASGACYFPGCDEPLIRWLVAEPVVALEIAHIHGAKPGSARFDSSMTDEQRRAFPNLIFLCTAHHKLVDRIKPEDFPAEEMRSWKVSNEGVDPDGLRGAVLPNDTMIESLIIEILRKSGPQRRATAHLRAGLRTPSGEWTSATLEAHAQLRVHNPHLGALPDAVIIEAVNLGVLAIEITHFDVHWDVQLEGSEELASVTLKGRNDFPMLNPVLPHRLRDGARVHWFTNGETIREHSAVPGFVSLRAEVGLATGGVFETEVISREAVDAAGFMTS